jgi:hypothetical protein
MKTLLKQLSLLAAIMATSSMNVFADNSPAQLDTTPPPPETALTADQTPPIGSQGGTASSAPSGSVGAGGGSIGATPAK